MTSNPLTTGKARKFVPDMPQDNYPAQRANAFHALRMRTEHLRQRSIVQDSLNRKADR
jgi:hypothetical protein